MAEKFVLTRDMVPIFYNKQSATFVCPTPEGYCHLLEKVGAKALRQAVAGIVEAVNMEVELKEEPFQNVLLGYENRTTTEKLSLLRNNFKIREWSIDQRGLYSVAISGAEGDVYISSEQSMKCDPCVFELRNTFFDAYAFYCHNMDYYWEALMVREVLIRYFNYLNQQRDV